MNGALKLPETNTHLSAVKKDTLNPVFPASQEDIEKLIQEKEFYKSFYELVNNQINVFNEEKIEKIYFENKGVVAEFMELFHTTHDYFMNDSLGNITEFLMEALQDSLLLLHHAVEKGEFTHDQNYLSNLVFNFKTLIPFLINLHESYKGILMRTSK